MDTLKENSAGDNATGQRAKSLSGNIVIRVLFAQLGLSMVLAVLFWGFAGTVQGYSALLGGLACVIPNAFLALRLVVPRRDLGAGALMRAAYIGELGKLALTILMFSMIFVLVKPFAAGPLFAGFIGAQVMTLSGFPMREDITEVDERATNGK